MCIGFVQGYVLGLGVYYKTLCNGIVQECVLGLYSMCISNVFKDVYWVCIPSVLAVYKEEYWVCIPSVLAVYKEEYWVCIPCKNCQCTRMGCILLVHVLAIQERQSISTTYIRYGVAMPNSKVT